MKFPSLSHRIMWPYVFKGFEKQNKTRKLQSYSCKYWLNPQHHCMLHLIKQNFQNLVPICLHIHSLTPSRTLTLPLWICNQPHCSRCLLLSSRKQFSRTFSKVLLCLIWQNASPQNLTPWTVTYNIKTNSVYSSFPSLSKLFLVV